MHSRPAVVFIAIILALSGCASMSDMSPRTRDTAIGAGVGASTGALIGAIAGGGEGCGDWRGRRGGFGSYCRKCVVPKNGRAKEGNGTGYGGHGCTGCQDAR